jgi:predicted membrane protein
MSKCDWRGRSPLAGAIISCVVILIGVLFLLENLGVFRIYNFWRLWPVLLIISGVVRMFDRRRFGSLVWGGFVASVGVLLLCDTFGLLHVNFNTVWPVGVIAFGVSMLMRAFRPGPFTGQNIFASDNSPLPDGLLKEVAVFSGTKRRIESKAFQGGEITCVFGGVDLDLRRAEPLPGHHRIVLDITATFGGVELKIPESWKVAIQGVAVFGAYEDKTVPPRPETSAQAPELVITGNVIFGAVNIEN